MTKEATLGFDDNVKLPAAVRAAAARSDELFNAMRDTPAEAPVTPQGNPELDAQSLLTQDNTPAPQADPAPTPAGETPQAAGEESWEHKYKSVHGRYVRQQEAVRTLTEQVQNLQNIIATLQSAPSQSAPMPDLTEERLITAEEASDYGEDFLKVVGKRAREELAPVIKGYQQKITELETRVQGLTGVQQQTSAEKLLSNLDEKLPNWRELNTNQEFLDWLSLPDLYSGAIRHDMLKAAYAQGDSSRVLAFFNGFLAEEATVAPVLAEPDTTTTKVAKVPLANLAAPGRAKTAAAAPAPAEKPIFSRAQIAAFYADVASGKYRGRDADKNRAEGMIFEAQREGRIR